MAGLENPAVSMMRKDCVCYTVCRCVYVKLRIRKKMGVGRPCGCCLGQGVIFSIRFDDSRKLDAKTLRGQLLFG
jgi:hypothetical protein